ncbi:MAG: penicillin acylase family protein [Desulfurococcales archaeon]|nr:penicillin acylase family protein [Desulfurococcales archaeon]
MRGRLRGLLAALGFIALAAVPIAFPALAAFIDPVGGVLGAGFYSSLPRGSFKVEGMSGEALIYFDSNGVPHVEAASDEAAFYAVGWLQASLRLFQMDLVRRIPQGTLSSLVGEAGVESDRLVLTLGFREAIEESYRILAENPQYSEMLRALEAYVRGVNDYIEWAKGEGALPAEYRLLGLEPEPWNVKDVLAVQKFFQLMLAWDTSDLVLGELVRIHGLKVIEALDAVERRLNMTHAFCAEATTWGEATGLRDFGPPIPLQRLKPHPALQASQQPGAPRLPEARGLVDYLASVEALWGRVVEPASNNWVVAGRLTATGKPLLANDPHLALIAPSLWMPIHIRTPTLNVAGVALPGAPLVVIGRNEKVAWGFTNVGSDFADFYYYEWRGDNYVYMGELRKPEVRNYEIRVWNPLTRTYTTITHRVLVTVHGPVLEWGGERYAVAFTGSLPSLELAFLWELNKAGSVREALAAQRYFVAPAQNMVVADIYGNIAYSPLAAYPVRVNVPTYTEGGLEVVNTGFLPYNGSRGEGEWAGFKPLSSLPVLLNPPRGYVATANARPFNAECWGDNGWDYSDRFREERIVDMIESLATLFTPQHMMSMQLDTRDLGLELVARIVVDLATMKSSLDEEATMMLETLKAEPSTSTDATWATVALLVGWHLREEVWKALRGPEGGVGFLKLEHIEALYEAYMEGGEGKRLVLEVLGKPLEDIVVEALKRAYETGRTYYGTPEPREWSYGEIHYYNVVNQVLEPLSFPRHPAPGGPYSVNVAPPARVDPREGAPVEAGPSVRLVADMSSQTLYLSLPGGSSGNPFSRFYSNLYQLWLQGRYIALELDDIHKVEDLALEFGGDLG